MIRQLLNSKREAGGFVAIAVACVFALQSLLFPCAAHSGAAVLDGGGAGWNLAYCSPSDIGDDKAPPPLHRDSADHCVLCAAASSPGRAPAVECAANRVVPAAPSWRRPLLDDRPLLPDGWMSSWSSRAPPSFS